MSDFPPAWQAVGPASKTTLSFPVAVRADGSRVEVPVLVVRGTEDGQTVLATAGIHGDEFEGMAALRRLYEHLEPARIRGTFVAVPIANPPAFEAGLRTNPDDRQDLARVFPGDAAGTVTEQLAFALTNHFIRHATFYCDLHSAGQYYAMPPMVGYQLRPEPLLTVQREAAQTFGLPLVWATPALPGRSLSAAGELNVPAIYAEITGEGRCRSEDVGRYEHGLRQVLAYFGLTGQTVKRHEPKWFVVDNRPQAGFLQTQNRAPAGGFFEPEVSVWQAVKQGQRVGTIRDAFGVVRHTVQATLTGRIVFLRTFPRVLAGDPICTVLEMPEKEA